MLVVSGRKPGALRVIPPLRRLSPDASTGVQTVPVAKKKYCLSLAGVFFLFGMIE
jgi:hypothetical protein